MKELCLSWDGYSLRSTTSEEEWIQGLSTYLTHIVDTRVEHVRLWISQNLEGFQKTPHASITALHRTIDATVIDIKANVELCKQPCNSCQLLCILNRRHDGRPHNCMTSHKCMRGCEFTDEHPDDLKQCGYPWVQFFFGRSLRLLTISLQCWPQRKTCVSNSARLPIINQHPTPFVGVLSRTTSVANLAF